MALFQFIALFSIYFLLDSYYKFIKVQIIVFICVKVLHYIIHGFLIIFLFLWVEERQLLLRATSREEN